MNSRPRTDPPAAQFARGGADAKPWFVRFAAPARSDFSRVVCFPHAGCGAAAFWNLTRGFFSGMDVLIAQYPGRETRLTTPPMTSMEELVDQAARAIQPLLDRPFIFFGHSMGAKVAYEVVRRLDYLGLPVPDRLVVSCSPAPHHPRPMDPAYKGSKQEFVSYLRRLGGMPRELLAMDEILDLILPVLRADFTLLDHYRPSPSDIGVKCPLTMIFSPQDATVSPDDVFLWREVAASAYDRHALEGGHFYFSGHTGTLADLLTAAREAPHDGCVCG